MQQLQEKVIIYTTNTCPYCHMAMDYFKKNNISFREINVEEHPDKVEEMVEKSGQMGVPVIDIKGQIIVGFNKNAIEHALWKK